MTPDKDPTPIAYIALCIGGFCELVLVALLRAASMQSQEYLKQIASREFVGACLVGCAGCACVTYAARFFHPGIVYVMWVGLGGLLISVVGMTVWNEPRTWVRLLGVALVLVGLGVLRFTLKPAGGDSASSRVQEAAASESR